VVCEKFERSNGNTKDGYQWQPSCFAVYICTLSTISVTEKPYKSVHCDEFTFFRRKSQKLIDIYKYYEVA